VYVGSYLAMEYNMSFKFSIDLVIMDVNDIQSSCISDLDVVIFAVGIQ
jgi:hypothetical protein